jgi:hypothetical protein
MPSERAKRPSAHKRIFHAGARIREGATTMRPTLLLGAFGLSAALATAAAAAQGVVTDIRGHVPGYVGNVVGGGVATLEGGGDDLVIVRGGGGAGGGGAGRAQRGRFARMAGGDGDGQQVEYLDRSQAGMGRAARLLGGGEDAEVVYLPR